MRTTGGGVKATAGASLPFVGGAAAVGAGTWILGVGVGVGMGLAAAVLF